MTIEAISLPPPAEYSMHKDEFRFQKKHLITTLISGRFHRPPFGC